MTWRNILLDLLIISGLGIIIVYIIWWATPYISQTTSSTTPTTTTQNLGQVPPITPPIIIMGPQVPTSSPPVIAPPATGLANGFAYVFDQNNNPISIMVKVSDYNTGVVYGQGITPTPVKNVPIGATIILTYPNGVGKYKIGFNSGPIQTVNTSDATIAAVLYV